MNGGLDFDVSYRFLMKVATQKRKFVKFQKNYCNCFCVLFLSKTFRYFTEFQSCLLLLIFGWLWSKMDVGFCVHRKISFRTCFFQMFFNKSLIKCEKFVCYLVSFPETYCSTYIAIAIERHNLKILLFLLYGYHHTL